MQATSRTPIADYDQKLDIIEHVNSGHAKALLAIAHVYINEQVENAQLVDLFEEGIILQCQIGDLIESHFVAFLTQDSLHHNVHNLAMHAMKKLGKLISQFWHFQLLKKQQVSRNMCRLFLKSDSPLADQSPAGYAWRFILERFSNKPDSQHINTHLGRYYTLRNTEKSSPNLDYADIAVVDIFQHNDTAGSLWTQDLTVGEFVVANNEFYEQTDHLTTGRALLIADETSLPTVAKLLENWQNPIPPTVISITQDPADQTYLNENLFPAGSQLFRFEYSESADQILTFLQQHPEIEKVWGALENQQAKTIRHYLRNERQFKAENNRVKAYWIKNKP